MFFKKETVTFTLSVAGMKCPKCAARVQAAAEAIRGVKAQVNLETGAATITAPEKITPAAVADAITAAGFTATAE